MFCFLFFGLAFIFHIAFVVVCSSPCIDFHLMLLLLASHFAFSLFTFHFMLLVFNACLALLLFDVRLALLLLAAH